MVKQDPDPVTDGNPVTLTCQFVSARRKSQYRWYYNGNLIEEAKDKTYLIQSADIGGDVIHSYSCEVDVRGDGTVLTDASIPFTPKGKWGKLREKKLKDVFNY